MTSGLIQYGVPTSDFLFDISLVTWAQNPKSLSFTCNSWSRKYRLVRHWVAQGIQDFQGTYHD